MTQITINPQAYYVINEAVTQGCWDYLYTQEAKENNAKKKYKAFEQTLISFSEKEFKKMSDANTYLKNNNLTKKTQKLAPFNAESKGSTYIVDREVVGWVVVTGQYLIGKYKEEGFTI